MTVRLSHQRRSAPWNLALNDRALWTLSVERDDGASLVTLSHRLTRAVGVAWRWVRAERARTA